MSVHADIDYHAAVPGTIPLYIDDNPTPVTPYLVFADLRGDLVVGGTFRGADKVAGRDSTSPK